MLTFELMRLTLLVNVDPSITNFRALLHFSSHGTENKKKGNRRKSFHDKTRSIKATATPYVNSD